MFTKYSESVITKKVTDSLVNELSIPNLKDDRLDKNEKMFLYNIIKNRGNKNLTFALNELTDDNVIILFNKEMKTRVNLVIPFIEDGRIKVAFNLYPFFNDKEKIDDPTLLSKLLANAAVFRLMLDKYNKVIYNNSFSSLFINVYTKFFLSILNKLYRADAASDTSKIEAVVKYYAAKCLLNRPSSYAVTFSKIENEITDDSYSSIEDIITLFDYLNSNIFEKNVKLNSFIKEFSFLNFSSMPFAIDMPQAFTASIVAYHTSNYFTPEFIRMSKVTIGKDMIKDFAIETLNVLK